MASGNGPEPKRRTHAAGDPVSPVGHHPSWAVVRLEKLVQSNPYKLSKSMIRIGFVPIYKIRCILYYTSCSTSPGFAGKVNGLELVQLVPYYVGAARRTSAPPLRVGTPVRATGQALPQSILDPSPLANRATAHAHRAAPRSAGRTGSRPSSPVGPRSWGNGRGGGGFRYFPAPKQCGGARPGISLVAGGKSRSAPGNPEVQP